MLALLAVGGYFIYSKYYAPGAAAALAPSGAMVPTGPAPDPVKLAYLRDWDKGYGLSSPEYAAMEMALSQMNADQVNTMYTAVYSYFGTGAQLPAGLSDQVDTIARQFHILGR